MLQQVRPEFERELKQLGERIKQIRLERGLSVRDLVISHDYHDAQWRRYEKGSSLTVPSLLRIANALNCTLSELVQDVGAVKGRRPNK